MIHAFTMPTQLLVFWICHNRTRLAPGTPGCTWCIHGGHGTTTPGLSSQHWGGTATLSIAILQETQVLSGVCMEDNTNNYNRITYTKLALPPYPRFVTTRNKASDENLSNALETVNRVWDTTFTSRKTVRPRQITPVYTLFLNVIFLTKLGKQTVTNRCYKLERPSNVWY